ncbi:hypothetical protein ECC02_001266 [Trypanosoma cruzi]|uniref:Spt4/RpoE2 zinc finger domain-containing protein n=1 Tax=Trypanosoma cruzi TaxID=5693 RepID=A0A7J6YG86_TRYCR|nr:hypothetical protein ECC02_001266 [Trypanosoma cruzi]
MYACTFCHLGAYMLPTRNVVFNTFFWFVLFSNQFDFCLAGFPVLRAASSLFLLLSLSREGGSDMVEEPPPQLPIGDRGYLACRQCRLILTETQFIRDGCSVCGTGPVSRDELHDVTTADFSNFVGLIAPEKSWVARMIGRTGCPNGVFAAMLNDEDEEEIDSNNDGDDGAAEEDDNEEEVGVGDEHTDGGGGHRDDTPPSSRPAMPVMTDEEFLATEK